MIRHSVILKFKSELNNSEKDAFFEAAKGLSKIPNVLNFEILKQISPKNDFEYGISMEFENEQHYHIYNDHALHQAFIKDFWIKNVHDFLEIDYQL